MYWETLPRARIPATLGKLVPGMEGAISGKGEMYELFNLSRRQQIRPCSGPEVGINYSIFFVLLIG